MKKIWLSLTGVATAAALAGCASTTNASVQPVAAESTPASTSPAPVTTTTTAPPVTTTTLPTTSTPTSTTQRSTTKPAPQPAAGVPCAITNGACVDISAKKAWLLSDGEVIYGPVPITTGRAGHATPTGRFHVLSKEKMHYSTEFDNAPMPNSVFFYPGDAFHTGSLSTPSHGCIHLSSTASLKFYNTLSVGDPVQVVP